MVTCFVLACGAVLGITAIISHGRATAQHKITTPSLFNQGSAMTPDPMTPDPMALGPVTPGSEPYPTLPAGVGASPGVSQPITVPHAGNTDQATDDNAGSAPVPTTSAGHIGKPDDSGKPADQVEPVVATKPSGSGKPSDTRTLADSKPGGSDPPTNSGTPHSDKPARSTVAGDQAGSSNHDAQDNAAVTIPAAQSGSGEISQPNPTGSLGSDSARRPSSRSGSASGSTTSGSGPSSGGASATSHNPFSWQGSTVSHGSTPIRAPDQAADSYTDDTSPALDAS